MPLICISKISSNQCLSHLLSALIKLSLISHSIPFEYLHSGDSKDGHESVPRICGFPRVFSRGPRIKDSLPRIFQSEML